LLVGGNFRRFGLAPPERTIFNKSCGDPHQVFAIAGSPGRLSGTEINFLAAWPDRFVVSAVSIWEMRLKWNALHASGDRNGPVDPAQAMQILAGQSIDSRRLTPLTPLRRRMKRIRTGIRSMKFCWFRPKWRG
jgi:hypothetical protein